MNPQPEAPPLISPRRAITYELTRWDLFANWMTVILRNRILQVFVIVALILNEALILGPSLATRSLWSTLLHGVIFLFLFVWILVICQLILGLASSFLLKQRGVVGRHTLEITEQGLVERTEFNETLHKWPSICRVRSLCGYLYIYVSDMNSHQVPKRCLPAQEIGDFEADLRAHATQARL